MEAILAFKGVCVNRGVNSTVNFEFIQFSNPPTPFVKGAIIIYQLYHYPRYKNKFKVQSDKLDKMDSG